MWEAKMALAAAVAALGFIACQPETAGAPVARAAALDAPVVQVDLADLESRELVPKEADDGCGARKLAGIIDRPSDLPGLPEASSTVRFLNPDSMATMDFRPDRLNIEVNAEGRIWKLRCG